MKTKKIKISDLEDKTLDWAVIINQGYIINFLGDNKIVIYQDKVHEAHDFYIFRGLIKNYLHARQYHKIPALWGRLMDENKINNQFNPIANTFRCYPATRINSNTKMRAEGINKELGVAICRCFVAMNTEGDSVEVVG